MTIEALRTPDERFTDLPDWPYEPHYVDTLEGYESLRMHYVDEGPGDGEVFLCLHGEPTWSYLYRRMIPGFLGVGARVVAPDLFGFGRSDKPVDDETHNWGFHRASLLRLVEHLDLRNVTLVVQDWGGLLGLTLPVDMPERFTGLLIMNTGFGVGSPPNEAFTQWQTYVRTHPDLDVGRVISSVTPHLTAAEIAAYEAPFPTPAYKSGPRMLPSMVPTSPDMDGVADSKRAIAWWSEEFDGRSFMAIGKLDPLLGSIMEIVHGAIRGCPEPLRLDDAGHFVQEWGDQVVDAALEAWGYR